MKSAIQTSSGFSPSTGIRITICFVLLLSFLCPERTTAQTQQTAFGPFTPVTVGSEGECVTIGDLNGDGRNDVVLGTERFGDGTNKQSVLVFLQTADGVLADPVRYNVGSPVSSVVIGDFTGDGRNDIAAAKTGRLTSKFDL